MASDRSSSAVALPSYAKMVEAYQRAVDTAATATAYAVLARGVARELLEPASWAVSLLRNRREPRPAQRHTLVIKSALASSLHGDGDRGLLYDEVRLYLATRIDPHSTRRLCLSGGGGGGSGKILSMEDGDSMVDTFEGVAFTWECVVGEGRPGAAVAAEWLELSFDAEHTDMALERYIPFISETVEAAERQDCSLLVYMNEGSGWRGITHNHPATFDTLAMDPELKQSVIADLDRFLKRRDYYRRIGKAWKRGYLLYGPPGTGKSSLVAAMANHLRFDLYDLDLSEVRGNSNTLLQRLLSKMSNKCILVIEDIDCCFSAASREDGKSKTDQAGGNKDLAGDDVESDDSDDEAGDDDVESDYSDYSDDDDESYYSDYSDYADDMPPPPRQNITLSSLLNVIDGLWSTTGEERIIVFTTNYKDRLDPALLRPGRMDMHIYMGYCVWEAFKTLAHNYFLVDDHPLFPEIQELLSAVEVTPAEVSEMLLRSEDVNVALQGLAKFLGEKKQAIGERK